MVPTMYTVQRKRPVLLWFYYLLPTVLLCLRVTGRLVHTVHTTRGICTLYAVSCTWYGYTYDDDEDDDMTRCRIHRDAALREAREREAREGLGRGKNCHGGDEGGEISPVRRVFCC